MYVLLILIVVDVLGLFSVLKRNDLDQINKVVFTLCIILLPIVGIIIYYLFLSSRKRRKFDISETLMEEQGEREGDKTNNPAFRRGYLLL